MLPEKIHCIYFSATGTTKKIVETFGRAFADAVSGPFASGDTLTTRDLLRRPLTEDLAFSAKDFVVVGAPVYSGRAAPVALENLQWLRGNNTPAVILTAYGNRAYDDTLIELKDFLEARGFVVVGAGAFVARHAVFPRYAVGRPDEQDLAVAGDFAARVKEKLETAAELVPGSLFVKGNRPYRKPVDMTLYPRASDACIGCGACAAICPAAVTRSPTSGQAAPRARWASTPCWSSRCSSSRSP